MYFGYGIVGHNTLELEKLNVKGLEHRLRLIEQGRLAMLCTESEEELSATPESMRNYTTTLCEVIKSVTIIPLRFGTVFSQEEEIRAVLKSKSKEYLKLLTKLDQKIEVELKVWWKKEVFMQTMLKNKRVARWKKALEAGNGKGYDVVEFGKAIEELANHERAELSKAFGSLLQPFAVDWVILDPRDEYQVYDGVFLVDRSREEEFDQATGKLHEKYSEIMVFKYTGPWAPHHFINS
ncbi:MAG: GvpL/GvpF family gas vesicle protein [Desulfitobacteriaceae bacterium]